MSSNMAEDDHELVWLPRSTVPDFILANLLQKDSYQLYLRYEESPPKEDWRKAALRGPALPTIGNAVAGAVGAAASNLATYPLSLIIARLQTQKQRGRKASNEGKSEEGEEYSGILDAARKIYAKEGISGLYSGLAQDTVKSVLDAFLFFLAYEFFRHRRIAARFGSKRKSMHTVLPVFDELAVGVLAGAFSKFFSTPLSNVVARKQTSGTSASSLQIVSKIRSEKGIAGLWSGYSASLILTLNPAITFFLNRILKSILRRSKREPSSTAATFLIAALSKSAASSITYPFSMAKTRSQVSGSSSNSANERRKAGETNDPDDIFFVPSIISSVIAIARTEGVSELYAGLRGEVLKGFFSHGFTMLAKDAVYAGIVRAYYLILILSRRYPSPEELLEAARERAEEYAEAAREGAKALAETAKSSTDEILNSRTGSVAVDMTSNTNPVDVDALGSNETAELVGDYVEDEAREWKSLYHWFWEKEKFGK
ncbi:mitochondrial carrier domain-containing protein [Aspergillus desertorum]